MIGKLKAIMSLVAKSARLTEGDCASGSSCVAGACKVCSCDGRECGTDECGNPCGDGIDYIGCCTGDGKLRYCEDGSLKTFGCGKKGV